MIEIFEREVRLKFLLIVIYIYVKLNSKVLKVERIFVSKIMMS